MRRDYTPEDRGSAIVAVIATGVAFGMFVIGAAWVLCEAVKAVFG